MDRRGGDRADRSSGAAAPNRRRKHARGSSLQNAIDLDEDQQRTVKKSSKRGPIPVIVLSDFDDDVVGCDDVSIVDIEESCDDADHESEETKPIIQGDDTALDQKPLIVTEQQISADAAAADDDNGHQDDDDDDDDDDDVDNNHHDTRSAPDHIMHDDDIVKNDDDPISRKQLNYDIVRDVFESVGDYCGFSQQTGQHEICMFTSPTTPWYLGYIHQQPSLFTLVFGCRDPARTADSYFLVNCLFIKARFAALNLGGTALVDQLIPLNTLLKRCLAHYEVQFDDNDSARSQTTSFMEAVNTVIDFLSIDADPVHVPDGKTATTRTWYITRSPITYSHARCRICGQAAPDLNHYNMHERDIWSKLDLDQRDQVFDLASQRRRRVRAGIALLPR